MAPYTIKGKAKAIAKWAKSYKSKGWSFRIRVEDLIERAEIERLVNDKRLIFVGGESARPRP